MSYQNTKSWRKKHPLKWQLEKQRYYKQFEANAINKKQRWTAAEINLVLKKVASDRCLAKWLGRSVKAIQCLRVRMKGKEKMSLEQTKFIIWAKRNDINLEDAEDSIDWWNCWANGFNVSTELYATWKDGKQLVGALQKPLKNCLLKGAK